MHYSTFDMSKDMKEDDFQEYLNEKRIRQDLENLTVDDFIASLLDTIDRDTTVDMVVDNLWSAREMINCYRCERIGDILNLKQSWEFIEEQKRREQRKQEESKIEVKA